MKPRRDDAIRLQAEAEALAVLGEHRVQARELLHALEQVAMTRLPRARFALLLSLLPATAAVIGAIILGQIPSALEAVGIALVVVASSLRTHVE